MIDVPSWAKPPAHSWVAEAFFVPPRPSIRKPLGQTIPVKPGNEHITSSHAHETNLLSKKSIMHIS